MKKNRLAAILLAATLCTAATGCTASRQEESEMPLTSPSATVSQKPSHGSFAGGNTASVGSQGVTLNSPQALRITYQQGTPNSVTCVSSLEQLQTFGLYGSQVLASYDQAFFEQNALVLVKYTVNSGSTQVSLGRAQQVSNLVSVQVDTQPAGIGTADMATWLLWAEVDHSLTDCQWVLEGSTNTGNVTQ